MLAHCGGSGRRPGHDAGGVAQAPAAAAAAEGGLRRRLLLVRRVGLRQGRGRALDDFRLHRRQAANPTYPQVSASAPATPRRYEIVFDPKKVSYQQLVEYFWRTIDPTVKDRQFCDSGRPYRTGDLPLGDGQMRSRPGVAGGARARPSRSKSRSSPRSSRPGRSTRPRTTTRTTTRRIRSATSTTATAAGAMPALEGALGQPGREPLTGLRVRRRDRPRRPFAAG